MDVHLHFLPRLLPRPLRHRQVDVIVTTAGGIEEDFIKVGTCYSFFLDGFGIYTYMINYILRALSELALGVLLL